jgi:anti-sigma factor RsiW
MQCNEVQSVLNAYADKELSSVETEQVLMHLQSCEACSRDHSEITLLKGAVNSDHLYQQAPRHLKQSLSASLCQSETTPAFFGTAKLAYGMAGLLLGTLLTWTTLTYIDKQQARDTILSSLASAHIRSLMAGHLTDVASSDTHTVKPWFHGQLDFSPPVIDLTSQGYPLIGGRLEYLSSGTAAALVYRHRKHTVNLFIQPKSSHASTQTTPYNGYNIIHWDTGNLSFWAVSDLNRADLENFHKLLTDGLSPQPKG